MATLDELGRALQAAHAAGDTKGATTLAAAYQARKALGDAQPGDVVATPAGGVSDEVNMPAAPVAAVKAPVPATSPGGDTGAVTRTINRLDRTSQNLTEGALGLPDIAYRPIASLFNKGVDATLGADSSWHLPGSLVDSYQGAADLLNKGLGGTSTTGAVAEPVDKQQAMADALERGTGGLASSMGVGSMLQNAASPLAQSIGKVLTTAPAQQAAATATGTAAAESMRQHGGGPGSQLAAALLGGLAPAGAQGAVSGSWQALKGLIGPLTEGGQQRIVADKLASVLTGTPSVTASTVPGVQRTLAEATQSPGIGQLQRALTDSDPAVASYFRQRATDNNAALMDALATDVAGTPAARQAALDARTEGTSGLYDLARTIDRTQASDAADVIAKANAASKAGAQQQADTLTQQAAEARNQGTLTPGMRAAAEARAADLEQQAGDTLKNAPRYTLQPDPGVAALQGRPAFDAAVERARTLLANQGKGDVDPLTSLDGQQAVKLALDQMASADPNSTLGQFGRRAVMDIKNQFNAATGELSPAYKTANSEFARLSKPIESMDLGQLFTQALNKGAVDTAGNATIAPSRYANAQRALDAMAEDVTGITGTKAADVLTPAQQATITNVGNEVANSNNALNGIRSAGSNSVQNLASQALLRRVGNATGLSSLGETGVGLKLGDLISKPARLIDAVYKTVNVPEDLKQKLVNVMLNPDTAESQAILAKLRDLQNSGATVPASRLSGYPAATLSQGAEIYGQ